MTAEGPVVCVVEGVCIYVGGGWRGCECVSIGSVFRVCVASRPAVFAGLLWSLERDLWWRQTRDPFVFQPQTGTLEPGETSDQLAIPHLFQDQTPGAQRGHRARQKPNLRLVRLECGPSFLPIPAQGSACASWS